MNKIQRTKLYILFIFFLNTLLVSCVDSKKITYFNDVKDSALIAAKASIEPVIQKKDILSISVSSVSNDAAAIFNAPNQPASSGAAGSSLQTSGYLVSEDGTIKFPLLGNLQAAGLTQKDLENQITKLLVDKKLLFDPIVTSRFLNFRITVLGEVNHPGVISVPSEQINILEAVGNAGDITIYGLRDNVILVRQEGPDKLVKRLDLTSAKLLQSPYFFLRSNDILYVEPNKAKIASVGQGRQLLPIIFSGISLLVIILNTLLK